MDRWGFVHEKLDIKFLILFVAARVIEPIPFSSMQELTMCDEGFGYFDFSDCLAELVSTGHLKLENGLYLITEKGRRNSRICESSLAYSVRKRAERQVELFNQKLRRQNLVRAALFPRENGTYTVSLSLSDDIANLLSLELMVPEKAMGETLCARFRENPEQLYGQVVETLVGAGKKTESEVQPK